MSLTLYDATVPQFIQILGGLKGVLEKAERFCEDQGHDPADIIGSRLCEDMYDLAYQVKSTRVHSVIAIQSLEEGVFSPDWSEPPSDFAGLNALVEQAIGELQGVSAERLNAMADQPMRFEFKRIVLPFTATTFLLSFSQPNFYFHATTAYDLLRQRGVKIGKFNFMGQMQLATPAD